MKQLLLDIGTATDGSRLPSRVRLLQEKSDQQRARLIQCLVQQRARTSEEAHERAILGG